MPLSSLPTFLIANDVGVSILILWEKGKHIHIGTRKIQKAKFIGSPHKLINYIAINKNIDTADTEYARKRLKDR